MYAAKDSGRNNYQFFTADMNARIVARMVMENELRRALERGEFRLHYQPQVDFGSGRILGVEALVRWNHPTRGVVAPASFISVAEESGLIVPLGNWIMREACRQGAVWRDQGMPDLPIAVNVSAKQFRHSDFVETVREAFADADWAPGQLEIELTESLLVRDLDHTLAQLEELKALGVRLSVDDFGTGYSSMSYLKRFPVDKLKVDRSFVRDLTTDANDRAIAASIIALGHQLGLRVVAEGVETGEQLAILREESCDEYQGFVFSGALKPEELTELLASNRRRRAERSSVS
jgi:EAL domain-containing protein (putative c-di-GMP-specific phosphodiesterase class I)